jgi:hypothetical protein
MQPDEAFNDQNTRDPQSWDLYSYVRNNPLRYTDPTGNACVSDGNGGWKDDNSGGETCAQVDQNNKNAQPSITVTADPIIVGGLIADTPFQRAIVRAGNAVQRGLNLLRNPVVSSYLFMLPVFGAFTVEEQSIADALEAEGSEVVPLEVVQGQKNPDALVDGVRTEFKTITVAGPNTLKNQIQDGLKQAPNVVVDARGTSITKEQAMQQIQRVEGNMGSVQGRVTILTNEGTVKH